MRILIVSFQQMIQVIQSAIVMQDAMITLCNADQINKEEKKMKLNLLARELEESKNKLKMIQPSSEGVKRKSNESNKESLPTNNEETPIENE